MTNADFLLRAYIERFDDSNISNDDLKYWLDNVWIPEARVYLETIKESEGNNGI